MEQAADIDEAWQKWTKEVISTVRQHIPQRPAQSHPKNKPWFCAEHHHLCRRRDRLFAVAKRTVQRVLGLHTGLQEIPSQLLYEDRNVTFITRCQTELVKVEVLTCGGGKPKYCCKFNRPKSVIANLEQEHTTASSDSAKANMLGKVYASYSSAPPLPTSPDSMASSTPSTLLAIAALKDHGFSMPYLIHLNISLALVN